MEYKMRQMKLKGEKMKKLMDDKKRKKYIRYKMKKMKQKKYMDENMKLMDGKILTVMLSFHMEERFDATVGDVADELGVHVSNKVLQNCWTLMKNEKGFIGRGEGRGLRLTSKGLQELAKPEYIEFMKDIPIPPKTNKEHQDRILKCIKGKSGIIFGLLLEYQRLDKFELAALSAWSRGLARSIAKLQDRNYIRKDTDEKFYLTSKCFLKGENTSPKGSVDEVKLARELAAGSARLEEKKRRKAEKKMKKKRKRERGESKEKGKIKKDDISELSFAKSGNKRRKKEMDANDIVKMEVVSVIPYNKLESQKRQETKFLSTAAILQA